MRGFVGVIIFCTLVGCCSNKKFKQPSKKNTEVPTQKVIVEKTKEEPPTELWAEVYIEDDNITYMRIAGYNDIKYKIEKVEKKDKERNFTVSLSKWPNCLWRIKIVRDGVEFVPLER